MAKILASRIDRRRREFFWEEFAAGRLRQGWGSTDEQNLNVAGPAIKNRTASDAQRKAWPNWPLMELERGDIVVVPSLPDSGWWVIARVDGPYEFKMQGLATSATSFLCSPYAMAGTSFGSIHSRPPWTRGSVEQ